MYETHNSAPSLMKSIVIPMRFEDLGKNPLIPNRYDPLDPYFPGLSPEEILQIHPHHFLELVLYLRAILIHHFLPIGRVLEEDDIKIEYLQIPLNSVPNNETQVILDKVRYVYDNYKGYVGPFSRVVGYIIAGVFEYGAGRPTEALIHLHRFLENVYEPDYGEYLLISPAFVLPPYVIIGCVLLILLRDRGGFDRLVAILSHYAKNEYASDFREKGC